MSKPDVALAGTDGDLVLGGFNNTTGNTVLNRTGAAAGIALQVVNNTGDGVGSTSTSGTGLTGTGNPYGVIAITAATNGTGLYGQANGTTGQSVFGSGSTTTIGVWGNSGSNTGVLGTAVSSHGIFGFSSGVGFAGIAGQSSSASGFGMFATNATGIGLFAQSTTNTGMFGFSGSGTAIVGRSTTGKAAEFFGNVEITGDFTASGMKSAAVKVADGSVRRMYCLESPVSFFEDMGSGQLNGGHGSVALDPMFLSTVSTDDYQVYLTPEGDCRGLFVESKSQTGFTVSELMGGNSTIKFSWRVVAKRTGITNERFAPVPMSLDPKGGPKPAATREFEIPPLPTAPARPDGGPR